MPDKTEMLEHKSFGAFEIKDEATGEVCAIVATLGVVDKDGDVLLPGAFPPSTIVKMSGYAHDVITEGAPPAGKGTLTVEGDKAIFRGRFFMSSARAREAFAVVKELGPDGEWSFGFPRAAVKTVAMTDEWRAKGARRLVAGLTPVEASPVFIGAGFGTGTLFTKEASEDAPPDPAIEAARLAAEQAERERADVAAKQLTINENADRRFRRPPAGLKAPTRTDRA